MIDLIINQYRIVILKQICNAMGGGWAVKATTIRMIHRNYVILLRILFFCFINVQAQARKWQCNKSQYTHCLILLDYTTYTAELYSYIIGATTKICYFNYIKGEQIWDEEIFDKGPASKTIVKQAEKKNSNISANH